MINANELRIGNYVSDNFASDSFFAQVKKLDFTRCHYGNFHSCYSDLKPIPITEEWLLKLGFENTYNSDFQNKYELNSDRSVIHVSFKTNEPVYVYVNNSYLRYTIHIHQLQNLYFALTQKELTLND